LMGLLRACADAVLIGAGTLRATPGHLWTPAHVYPELATEFLALRSALGRSTEPQLVVVTSSGKLDASHPALVKGAIVMTTLDGAKAIGNRLPKTCEVVATRERLGLSNVLADLRRRGMGVVLTEGGPHVIGQLIEAGLLDEAFLTVSPVIAGRKDDKRLGMVEGVELMPGHGAWSSLSSVRRHGDYLFLRYRTPGPAARA
jgi:riboflavin biosynthesis pyrimidine reductase